MFGKYKEIHKCSRVYFKSHLLDKPVTNHSIIDLVFLLFSIIVYKSSQRSKKVRLQHFFTPDKSPVTSLVYKKHCLYAGLVSGSVAIYSRSQGGFLKKWKHLNFLFVFYSLNTAITRFVIQIYSSQF